MTNLCRHCGAETPRKWCSRACLLLERREAAAFARIRLSQFDRNDSGFPNFLAELRTGMLIAFAWSHRIAPRAGRACLAAALLFAGCAKRAPVITPASSPSGTVANVGVTPYDSVSPFVCTISQQELTCMASMDVRFRRGQSEVQIARGYQFRFHTPKGDKGSGTIWFGCAGQNECPGYFMFGSPTVSVVPVEPARVWTGGDPLLVPHGSLGIIEVDINASQFQQIRNRWTGSIAPPLLKAGPGVVITCTDQACTVALK